MGSQRRKASDRRLADMNAAEPEQSWMPDLDPEGEEYSQPFPIQDAPDHVSAVQRMTFDRYGRIFEWAVVQRLRDPTRWRRIAVYDICHGKGMHIHLYDSAEDEFTQIPLRPVRSYRDIEKCLDEALYLVEMHWEDNIRRSNRGH